MTPRELIQTWFQRVWSQQDASAIDEFFVPDGQAHGLGDNPLIGPKQFRVFHQMMCSLLKDIEIEVDKGIEEGAWTAVLCTLKAQCTRSGKPVSMTGNVWFHIEDGKILEGYNHWDFFGLFGQLDLVPEETFGRALAGQR